MARASRRPCARFLAAIGEDPDRDGLRDTPARVARAYEEMFAGLAQDPADVLSAVFELGHEEMILVKDIELYSMCEHHLVPFHGVAHVAYIPGADGRITGLSKIARLVDVYAKRPRSRSASPLRSPMPWSTPRRPRRDRRGRGGAPVHVDARSAQARLAHRDTRGARASCATAPRAPRP